MAVKGKTNNPNGRPPNVPNKATTSAREAIASFVEGNTARLNGLLDAIENGKRVLDKDGNPTEKFHYEPNPKAAFDCIMGICEYHLPKLNRTDSVVTGPNGGPVQMETTVRFVE